MKLWLVSQDVNGGYDTYDSAVVAARTEDEAKRVRVGDYGKSWGGTWAAPEHVTAKLIGTATKGTEPGVVCASFNAG